MAIYVDTASRQEACQALSLGIVRGITTNPSLMRKTGGPELKTVKELLKLDPKPLFVQLSGTTADDLLKHLESIRAVFSQDNLVFKLAPTWRGIKLCSELSGRERFLITAVNTLEQAFAAQEAGAEFVALYLHRYRLRNGSWPPLEAIKGVTRGRTRVMIASCHDIAEVRWALVNGADDITLPLSIIRQLLTSRDSEEDIARFDRDVLRVPES